ncbi:hypothetical protein B0H14DRAFT_2734597 [Mycena olivaceomarginata]|nr:hypothetical protein B0H14DRAFT_2734597 [Mycena olivaceomarginata]
MRSASSSSFHLFALHICPTVLTLKTVVSGCVMYSATGSCVRAITTILRARMAGQIYSLWCKSTETIQDFFWNSFPSSFQMSLAVVLPRIFMNSESGIVPAICC